MIVLILTQPRPLRNTGLEMYFEMVERVLSLLKQRSSNNKTECYQAFLAFFSHLSAGIPETHMIFSKDEEAQFVLVIARQVRNTVLMNTASSIRF